MTLSICKETHEGTDKCTVVSAAVVAVVVAAAASAAAGFVGVVVVVGDAVLSLLLLWLWLRLPVRDHAFPSIDVVSYDGSKLGDQGEQNGDAG